MKKAILAIFFMAAMLMPLSAAEYKWENNPQDTAALEKSVAKAAREFNFVIRKIASSRLRKATTPYKTITLTINDDKVAFARDGKDPINAVIGGPAVQWLDNKVTFVRLSNGSLKQTFIAEDGQREFLYVFNADGSLTIKVKLASEKLKNPMEYTLKYVPVK